MSNISVSLTSEQKAKFKECVDTMKSILNFTVNLTPKERASFRKVGEKRIGYVNSVHTAIKANPDVVSASFKIGEYDNDVALYNDLTDFMSLLRPLFEGLEDTLIAVGSEAIKETDECYAYLKTVAKKSGNQALSSTVKAIADQLKQKNKGKSE